MATYMLSEATCIVASMGRTSESMKGKRYALRHGHTGRDADGKHWVSSTYKAWQSMKERCRIRPNYAGRGITVCERWEKSFPNFLADMGERPGDLTLDRINNDGNYEPGNCRWATRSQQQLNRRRPVKRKV